MTQNPCKGNQYTRHWQKRFLPALVMQPNVLGLYLQGVNISYTGYESRRLSSEIVLGQNMFYQRDNKGIKTKFVILTREWNWIAPAEPESANSNHQPQ